MANAEVIDLVRAAVEIICKLLERSTGLGKIARLILAYYALATYTIPYTRLFPILVLRGVLGCGKSQAARIMKAFCYRARGFSLRGMSAPSFRDALHECNNGTAVIEEGDTGWRTESRNYDALISDRYHRESAKAMHKVSLGDGEWADSHKDLYGATIVHRRLKFADNAVEGRSIPVQFTPNHKRKYKDFFEDDPVVKELKKRLEGFTFEPPELHRSFDAAGRILDSYAPILAVAEMCGDEEFLNGMESLLATSTEQLKEDQSVEPSGPVVRALVERLSTNGNGFVFRYVSLKDLKASIFAHSAIDLMPQQIAQLARELGFKTTESHGFTVVIPTAQVLVAACERVGYEDEEIAKLREQIRHTSAKQEEGE